MVRDLVRQECVSLVSLQETKLDDCDEAMITDMFSLDFDFSFLPACHTCGGSFWLGEMIHGRCQTLHEVNFL